MNFLDRFSNSTEISNLMKIRPVEAELFHENGLTNRYVEDNSPFSQYFFHIMTYYVVWSA